MGHVVGSHARKRSNHGGGAPLVFCAGTR